MSCDNIKKPVLACIKVQHKSFILKINVFLNMLICLSHHNGEYGKKDYLTTSHSHKNHESFIMESHSISEYVHLFLFDVNLSNYMSCFEPSQR